MPPHHTSLMYSHGARRRRLLLPAVPYLGERSDDDLVVARRIELEKAVEELLQIVCRVDLFLKDHLKHGLPEILVGIVGDFDDRDAVLDFGAGVGE